MIPTLDLRRQYTALEQEIDEAIKEVLVRGQFVLGPVVEDFERRVATYPELTAQQTEVAEAIRAFYE